MQNEVQFTPEELEARLSQNYTGPEEEEAYTGEDDIYLDYVGGQKNLESARKSTNRMGFTITNNTTTQKVIALGTASYKTARAALVFDDTGVLKYAEIGGDAVAAPSTAAENDILTKYNEVAELLAAGHRVDAVLDDGIIYSDGGKTVVVSAASSNASIRHFMEFVKNNPTYFVGMHIVSSDESMYESEFVSKKCSPFKVYDEVRLPFQDYFDPKNFNTKKIIVKENFHFDNETLSTVTIPAGATVTFTFVAAAIESNATALKNKVQAVQPEGKKLVKPALKPKAAKK